jgi:hypothetical protein
MATSCTKQVKEQEMKVSIVNVGWAMCAILGGCGANGDLGSPRTVVNHGSPTVVLMSFQKAYESRDFAGMLACMKPEEKASYRPLFQLAKAHWDATQAVSSALDRKFGEGLARVFVAETRCLIESPLGSKEQDARWNCDVFRADGEWRVVVNGEVRHGIGVCEKGGKWYVQSGWPDDVPRVGRGELDAYYQPQIRRLEGLAEAIRRSGVSEKEIYRIILDRGGEVNYGEPTDNVAIELRPLRGPVYDHGLPMTFRVTWYFEEGDSPRIWRMPSLGLGEGIILEIDGETLVQPAHEADVIRGMPRREGYNEWWFTLPPNASLPPGPHTLRYSFVSSGDIGPRGQRAKELEGRVVSNTLRIFVD